MSSDTRVAAIDIGTNSVLLLVAEARPEGLFAVREEATITRLGEGVDRTRKLADAAIARTLACLESYAGILSELGVARVAAVGTSAMRDAEHGDVFRERAAQLLGTMPRTISGDEEAALTHAGALAGIERDPARPVLVFDVGGGSTELIFGDRGEIRAARSLDVGSVRLTERHVKADPPDDAELSAVAADVRRALSALPRPADDAAELVGVAGTVTSLCAVSRGVAPYDARRVHGARMRVDELDATIARLRGMTTPERAALPGLSPKRADVIVAGAVLVREVVEWARVDELVVSDRGVRWGLAMRLAADARA